MSCGVSVKIPPFFIRSLHPSPDFIPTLYGITNKFLDYFGLSSKDDLIKINREFEVIESIDLFDTKYTESS